MKSSDQDSQPGDSAVLYRSPGSHYPVVVSGQGMTLTDGSGREYLDMSGGAAVSCLGHSHPAVIQAVKDQLDTLAFAHTRFFTHGPQEALASALRGRFGDPRARVYITSGGSEANETALKAAWQYWRAMGAGDKQIVISRQFSYHGNTFGTLSVSGHATRRLASAAPLIDWPRIDPCYAYRYQRSGESAVDYGQRSASELDLAIKRIGAERIAAFIYEPVVGSSLGVVPAAPGYAERIREICSANDVLMIADEVMCGSGRTGRFFAWEHDGVRPDIVTLGKGIGAGVQPLAATVLSGAVADVLVDQGFSHGHTYVGHPAACAAGVAVQRVLEDEGLLQRATSLGEKLLSLLLDRFARHPHVGDIRGRGPFAALELVADRATKAGFSTSDHENAFQLPEAIRRAAMAEGVICYPSGTVLDGRMVAHIMLAPPLVATTAQLEDGLNRLSRAIDSVLGTRPIRAA